MRGSVSLDLQCIYITDYRNLDTPIEIMKRLQLDRRLPEGRKTCEQVLTTLELRSRRAPPGDQEKKIDKQFVFHGQCLILGDSGVGKTSLVKSLTGEPLDPRQAKTRGIDQSLVDKKWENLTMKDLMFGGFRRYSKRTVAQLTLFAPGNATNILYQDTMEWKPIWQTMIITLSIFAIIWSQFRIPSISKLIITCSSFVLIILLDQIIKMSAVYFGITSKHYMLATFAHPSSILLALAVLLHFCINFARIITSQGYLSGAMVIALAVAAWFLFWKTNWPLSIERQCRYPGQLLVTLRLQQSVGITCIRHLLIFCGTIYKPLNEWFRTHWNGPKSFTAVAIIKAMLNTNALKRALDKKFASLTLKILDFAGDDDYYAFHHMFLRRQAIYVIAYNMAEFTENEFGETDAKVKRLQFWFESICSHVPPTTPIFLVGTHSGNVDKNCIKILDGHLRRTLWDTYCDELVVNDVEHEDLIFFPVENSNGNRDAGVQALQKKIMSVAQECRATIACDIPLSWIRIQDAIIALQKKKEAKFCLTLEEFPVAFDNYVCTNWSIETLKYFHEKGLIIYLDKEQDLSNWVLLKPEILVNVIIQLITPPSRNTKQRGLRCDWNLLQRKGVLTKSLLRTIISKVQENEEAMTAFLEEYDFICPLRNKKVEVGSLRQQDERQPTHFIPSLLPKSADGEQPVWHDDDTDKKFYVFFNRFLPEPLFHRLLSRAHKNSKVEFPNGSIFLYRNAGKFWMSAWQPYRLELMKEEKMVEVTFSCR